MHFKNEKSENLVIGPPIGPKKGPHKVTVTPKIPCKEPTWENMALSIGQESAIPFRDRIRV